MAELRFDNFNATNEKNTARVAKGMADTFVAAVSGAETTKTVKTVTTCRSEFKEFVKVTCSKSSSKKEVKKAAKRLDKALRKNAVPTHSDCVGLAAGMALTAAPVYALGNAVLCAVALGKDIVEWGKEVKSEKDASK